MQYSQLHNSYTEVCAQNLLLKQQNEVLESRILELQQSSSSERQRNDHKLQMLSRDRDQAQALHDMAVTAFQESEKERQQLQRLLTVQAAAALISEAALIPAAVGALTLNAAAGK